MWPLAFSPDGGSWSLKLYIQGFRFSFKGCVDGGDVMKAVFKKKEKSIRDESLSLETLHSSSLLWLT